MFEIYGVKNKRRKNGKHLKVRSNRFQTLEKSADDKNGFGLLHPIQISSILCSAF